MRLINIVGSNATGKTTRVKAYTDTLGDFSFYPYHLVKTKRSGVEVDKTIVAGRIYTNGLLVIPGDKTWGDISDQKSIATFIRKCRVDGIKTILSESYYFGPTYLFRPPKVYELFDEADIYVFYYDTVEEYLMRCNTRSGRHHRTMDWAINSAGWKSNRGFQKMVEEGATRVSVNASEDWLINKL